MNGFGLLLGIFAVPALGLWLGHGFRDRSPRQRSIFWGLVIGYGFGLVGVSAVLMVDPVLWTPAQPIRTVVVYWGLLGSGVLGSVMGGLRSVSSQG